ncbi:unnamed protein product [Rangifer tarandus platyrhynchus]|uniref:Uncharacterized protein n=2 Tax=Rangifer tarandus platyrhynchus TaxID=3082113 RepID=A0ABN9A0F2_RANTA|nr:unnamed protein product [Rangifer tarandus platyrhynchus]
MMTLRSSDFGLMPPLCVSSAYFFQRHYFYHNLQTVKIKRTNQTHLPITFSSLCKYYLCKHYEKGSKQFESEYFFPPQAYASVINVFLCGKCHMTVVLPSVWTVLVLYLSVCQELRVFVAAEFL